MAPDYKEIQAFIAFCARKGITKVAVPGGIAFELSPRASQDHREEAPKVTVYDVPAKAAVQDGAAQRDPMAAYIGDTYGVSPETFFQSAS